MKFGTAIAACVTVMVASSWLAVAAGDEPDDSNAAVSKADICKLLTEARDLYLADGAGEEAGERILMYTWQREHISHSPLLHIASGLVRHDDSAAAIDTANAIEELPTRAFTLIQIAKIQQKMGHKDQAVATLEKGAAVIKHEDFEQEYAASLWPHVLGALLQIEGNLATAKTAAQDIGCPWEALDKEERQYQLAQFHLAAGDVESARKALIVLPPETFAQRKGQQALRADDGVGFYAWIGRSVQAPGDFTADNVLLEWTTEDGKPEQIEAVLANFKDDDPLKLAGYMDLAQRYKKAGQLELASKALTQAETLARSASDQKVNDRLTIVMRVHRLEFEGKSLPEAIKTAGLLEQYRDEPWVVALLPDVLMAGDLQLAQDMANKRQLDDQTRAHFAVALTKAGKHQQALEYVKQAKELLGAARILSVVALQQHENGDQAEARRTIREAIARAKKVKSTNRWDPPKGEVRLQEKLHVMTRSYCYAVQIGGGEDVLEQFSGDGSIRSIANAFGGQRDTESVRKWIDGFDQRDRAAGARCLALLGLAEGLSNFAK